MTVQLELWHLVVLTTGGCWFVAWRIRDGGYMNPFPAMLAVALYILPILFWSAFFIGRLT